MFRPVAAVYEEIPHFNARRLPTRRHIGLVCYEDPTGLRVADKGPTIAIRCATIKLSELDPENGTSG
jgi:hypothetical protein